MKSSARILLIEDDTGIATALQRELRREGYHVTLAARGDEGKSRALSEEFDAIITDLKMPGVNGLELVEQLHQARPKLPIILMTAYGTTDTAIEATKRGAFDYVLKPFDVAILLDLTARAVASSCLMSEPVEIGDTASPHSAIIGNSRAMQEIYKEIGRVAATPIPVLIRGDTGTGKELIARAIYQHSNRAEAPFIAVNCAAIPETLLESELFGHERGSFTGAEARRIGRFEQADGGTLFLDEIGDLSGNTQAKLLRALQEKYIHRVGGKETIPVNVRLIAATHRDLETAMTEGLFRDDLFYRLSVVTIRLPQLKDRSEDIPALTKYFLARHATEAGVEKPSILPEAIEALQHQPWPGNVRELENVIRQALLLARGYPVNASHIAHIVSREKRPPAPANQTIASYLTDLLSTAQQADSGNARAQMIEELDRELFTRAIHLAQGNQAKAARWLGVTRLTLREKLLQFGEHPSHRGDPNT